MSIYTFDQTGLNPNNLVSGEAVSVSSINGLQHNYIKPLDAPFFGDTLVVIDRATGLPLRLGVDYVLTHKYQEGFDNLARPIHGSFTFLDANRTGDFYLQYQTIGYDFVTAASRLITSGMDALINLQNADWTDLYNVPVTWPPTTHTHPITDIDAVADIIDIMQDIANNIASPHSSLKLDDVTDLETGFITPLLNELSGIKGAIIAKAFEANLYNEQITTGVGLADLGPKGMNTWFDLSLALPVKQTGDFRVQWSLPESAVRDRDCYIETRYLVDGAPVTMSYSNGGTLALADGMTLKLQARVTNKIAPEFRIATDGAATTFIITKITV